MRFVLHIASVLSTALILGCTQKIFIPVSQVRFDTPEANGHRNTAVAINLRPSHKAIYLTDDYKTIPVNTLNPVIADTYEQRVVFFETVPIAVDYGFLDDLDIGILLSTFPQVYIKYQLTGVSQASAKKGNISSAIKLRVLQQSSVYNDNGVRQLSVTDLGQDISVSAGYRLTDDVMIYTSLFTQTHKYLGYVNVGSFPGPFNGHFTQNGISAAVHYDITKRSAFDLELVNTTIAAGISSNNSTVYNLRVVVRY